MKVVFLSRVFGILNLHTLSLPILQKTKSKGEFSNGVEWVTEAEHREVDWRACELVGSAHPRQRGGRFRVCDQPGGSFQPESTASIRESMCGAILHKGKARAVGACLDGGGEWGGEQ